MNYNLSSLELKLKVVARFLQVKVLASERRPLKVLHRQLDSIDDEPLERSMHCHSVAYSRNGSHQVFPATTGAGRRRHDTAVGQVELPVVPVPEI